VYFGGIVGSVEVVTSPGNTGAWGLSLISKVDEAAIT
jgi:hypothetical protein